MDKYALRKVNTSEAEPRVKGWSEQSQQQGGEWKKQTGCVWASDKDAGIQTAKEFI